MNIVWEGLITWRVIGCFFILTGGLWAMMLAGSIVLIKEKLDEVLQRR